MLFMVIEHFKDGDPKPVGERFRQRWRMMPEVPEVVIYLASWIDSPNSRCFQSWKRRIENRLTRGSVLGMIWWTSRSFRSNRLPSSGRRFNCSREYSQRPGRSVIQRWRVAGEPHQRTSKLFVVGGK